MKESMKNKILLALFVVGLAFTSAKAQPTDAQFKKTMMSPKAVSITLGKPGKVEWSSTYKKYMWTRFATIKLKTEEPGIFVIWYGYAAYDVVGGRYTYWRSFTTQNTYEGLPNLTNADLPKLVEKFGYKEMLSEFHYNSVQGGKVETLRLAPEPKFEWSTPNAVEFYLVAEYVKDISKAFPGAKPQKVEQQFRLKLQRENTKSEWNWCMNTWSHIKEL